MSDIYRYVSCLSPSPSPPQLQAAPVFALKPFLLLCFTCCYLTGGGFAYFPRKFDDYAIRIFCFQTKCNTGPCHFQSQGRQPFVWFSGRAEQDQLFQVHSREEDKSLISYEPTSQISLWLLALNCDNLCPLNQSCTTTQHSTIDLAIS